MDPRKSDGIWQNHIMCFIDYCVDHSRLWNTLRSMGMPEHLILLIKGLYMKQEAAVRTEYSNTE